MDHQRQINLLLIEVRDSFIRLRAALIWLYGKHSHSLSKWPADDVQFIKSKYDSCLAYSSAIGCFDGYMELKNYLQINCLLNVYDKFIKYWI